MTLAAAIVCLFLGSNPALACFPEDGMSAVEIAFTEGEVVHLDRLRTLGDEGREYRVEQSDTGDVIVYIAPVDHPAMVKIGDRTAEFPSVVIVVPDQVNTDSVDFPALIGREVDWLASHQIVTGLSPEMSLEQLEPGERYFTGDRTTEGLNCIRPGECENCEGPALFTVLPDRPLRDDGMLLAPGGWGWLKNLIAGFF